MKKVLRYIQTYFPFLQDIKFSLRFFILKVFKRPHKNDFKALKLIKPEGGEIFVEIGANRGESIWSTLHMTKDHIQMVGFEPNKMIKGTGYLNTFCMTTEKYELYFQRN